LTDSTTELDLTSCGAILGGNGDCVWRVWAPRVKTLSLVLYRESGERSFHTMEIDEGGYYSFECSDITEGQRYSFLIDQQHERPDPASRWQPEGVHKPSAVWCPESFQWNDACWKGISKDELVLYEVHVGTFTSEGTFAAMIPRLKHLRELGITAIELMPVAQCPGRWNWGYDGVHWYAVQNNYGGPRELQRLVNACHEEGLGVFLDLVFNHLGPEGNYLGEFGPYQTERFQTPWGGAINYNESGSQEVRAFVRNNVRQWVRDFHIDGLRLDATHSIYDSGPRHILTEIKRVTSEEADRRGVCAHVIAESNVNDAKILLNEEQGGYEMDAIWNDDFHHCIHTLLTGEQTGYYRDYLEPADQLTKVLNCVFAYDGGFSHFRGHRHGLPVENRHGDQFVVSIQNHDQVGNRARGERLSQLVHPAQLRLAAAMMLLSPYTPLLFMGEEFGATTPFPFFCDFSDSQLRTAVRLGRRREFPEIAWTEEFADPLSETAFQSAKLDWPDQQAWGQPGIHQLYRDLLAFRRDYPALQDRLNRTASLIATPQGPSLIRLERGDPRHRESQIDIYFNLTQHSVTIPSSAFKDMDPIVRTEDTRYEGTAWGERFWGEFMPYECIAFRHHGEAHK